jgi:bacterial/archaeal transporter family protein
VRTRRLSLSWFVPAAGYVVAIGALGVTSKLALETLTWQQLLPWTLLAYGVTVGLLMAVGQTDWRWHSGTAWAVVTAALAVGSLVLLFVALGLGEASKVVPVTAAYPAATVVLSALFLAENISPARVAGLLMIIVGVVVLTLAR